MIIHLARAECDYVKFKKRLFNDDSVPCNTISIRLIGKINLIWKCFGQSSIFKYEF